MPFIPTRLESLSRRYAKKQWLSEEKRQKILSSFALYFTPRYSEDSDSLILRRIAEVCEYEDIR